MSFREKSAWVTLILILLVFGFYFLHFPFSLDPPAGPGMFHALVYCIISFIVIEIVAHIVIAIQSPRDAQAPKDERDQLIELKSVRNAAYVFAFGAFMAIFTIHFGANAIAVGYYVLLAFVIAEVVNYTSQIIYYRRGV